MYIARWALISASLLAAFHAWLWAGQGSLLAVAGCVGLAVSLVALALLSRSRFATTMGRAWVLPRAAGESERRHRFKVALAWLAFVAVCLLGCITVRDTSMSDAGGIALRVFAFVAALMALQSFFMGLFRPNAAIIR